MLHPKTPKLSLRTCFFDSFTLWVNHIPVLFIATFLTFFLSSITFTLFMGSLYAGLLMMLLQGLRGEKPILRDLFGQFRRFIRFFSITLFILLFFIFGLALLAGPLFFLSNTEIPSEILQEIEAGMQEEGIHLRPREILQFVKNSDFLVPAILITFCFIVLPGIFFIVKCFYMYLLAADRGVHLDEAYVESRKAVERYGFRKHFFLIFAALAIFFGSDLMVRKMTDVPIAEFFPLFVFPFAVGLFVSAYHQTLEAEARQSQFYREEFEVMRDELQTAHDMQMELLPDESPELSGFSLDGTCIPANNVGGDYFAYRWLDTEKTRLAILVADVSGKAMEAAVTALRFNEMLRYESRARIDPGEILDGLNDSLEGQIDTDTFITCVIGVLDITDNIIHIANAGHCFPYHYRDRDQKAVPVNLTGCPLGLPAIIRPEEPYETRQVKLEPGDMIAFYSDGVVEAQNARHELYEDERFEKLLETIAPGAKPDRVVRAVVREVNQYIGDAPRTDDVTIVVLKRDGQSGPANDSETP
ncbi:MAG: PP2C family protein-serine/threonine phosphatase [bacterium]|nr:PP2C family protein-serine/threonine phosphatase [bacterium]